MSYIQTLFILSSLFSESFSQGNIPFLSLLSNGNIAELTQLATKLATSAAQHSFAAQKDALTRPGTPEAGEVSLNSKPSEIIGQSFTNAISPAITKLKELPEQSYTTLHEPPPLKSTQYINNSPGGALIGLARAFLGGNRSSGQSPSAYGVKQLGYEKDPIPSLKEIAPGARCLPFLDEFMKVAYGNCAKVADQKTWDTWGGQISNVLLGGKVDFLEAARETCKRGAERTQCGQLRRAISECDILGSLQIGLELQRAMQRCEEVSGIIDQNPVQILNQVNGVIGGEVAQGFLHKFLG